MTGESSRPKVDQCESEKSAAPDSSSTSLGETGTFGPVRALLLQKARAYWWAGDWANLSALRNDEIDGHPDRGKLALFIAVGAAQLGDLERARTFAERSMLWGCKRDVVSRILIGGVHNSIACAASLVGDETVAKRHFEASIAMVSPWTDVRSLGSYRNIQEKTRLGQVSEAAKFAELQSSCLGGVARTPDAGGVRGPLAGQGRRLGAEISLETPPVYALSEVLARHWHKQEVVPDQQIRICCHHKTGTNFVLPTFREIEKRFGLTLWQKFYHPEPDNWQMVLHQHSRVFDISDRFSFKGVHVVRHPMGLIYSAMRYHELCDEPWAHLPLDRFTGAVFWAATDRSRYNIIKNKSAALQERINALNSSPPPEAVFHNFDSGYSFEGRTYSEMLQDIGSIEDKILFEMRCYSYGVIMDMLSFPSDQRFYKLKLEEVSHDNRMVALEGCFEHLGFGGSALAECLEISMQHCLWNIRRPTHATTGVSEEWREFFNGRILDAFRERFGFAENALGYY